MDPAWIALIGTLLGGPAVLKIIDALLSRGQKRTSEERLKRDELREEIEVLKKEVVELKEELRTLEKELDSWKEKYFALMEDYLHIKAGVQGGENVNN